MLSEDEICMLKLSCLEKCIEQDILLNIERVFELFSEEQGPNSFDCDENLIDEKIFLLQLSWKELFNELEYICDWKLWDNDDCERYTLYKLVFTKSLSEDETWMLELSCLDNTTEHEDWLNWK